MEILIVLGVLGVFALFALGQTLYLWLGLLAVAIVIGVRTGRRKCSKCARSLIAGRGMKFCNQCGAGQPSAFRLRCLSCMHMARFELNMNFCNHCGTAASLEGV